MSDCLGLYIEKNLIKYAKVSKERDNIKVEAFGFKNYDKLDDALKQIIQETYSYKTPISINLSDEFYNYFEVFSMLNKKDIERAIKTEFEYLCEEKGYNKSVLDTRHFSVAEIDSKEKIRAIHIAVNKTEIAKKTQQLEGYKLRNISPLPVSITNLVELKNNENIAIVNLEEKTSVTIIVNGQIYKIDLIEHGMKEIFDKINSRENSYAKAYEVCKNTTIYTSESSNLQIEENIYLEEIMPTLYSIVRKVNEIVSDETLTIAKVYITGSGALINNIDLYFQETIRQIKCEILKPYFIQLETLRLNIKDYIEVNSAIALALQGLGEGLKDINFKQLSLTDKIELPSIFQKKEEVKEKDDKKASKFEALKTNFSFNLSGGFDVIEKYLLHLAGAILIVIILYSIFSNVAQNQIEQKQAEVEQTISSMNTQIGLVDNDINKIKSRTAEYKTRIDNLNELNRKTSEKYEIKNAVPNLLNRLMSIIPTNVQLTSIETQLRQGSYNSSRKTYHAIIKAQAKNYEQLGILKAQIILDNVLLNVKSDTSTKQDGLVKVTMEGDLP